MDSHQKIITKNAEDTAAVGESLANSLKTNIVCLYGELGSGKTTFTQGFAKGLGITSRLLSPTFIIVRRYNIPYSVGFLYHLDLYRMQTETDLQSIGISDILSDTKSVVLIEWAERLGAYKPQKRTDISLSLNQDETHTIDVTTL
jgi:tRNA threonylcarbamoyladenosine biosynthesis protein TsaE